MAKVLLKFQQSVLKEIPVVKSETTVGRNPNNDIVIDNMAVSGFHAKITRLKEGFVIEDQNSLNGTFLNGKKVGKGLLKNGDQVLVGKHSLVFVQDEMDSTIPTAESKGPAVEATMVLDTRQQKEMLSKTAAPSAAKEVLGVLAVIEGGEKKEYELKGRLSTIGKDETSTIKIKGFFAPKVAALINRAKEGYVIAPPGGGSKIKVNGHSVEGRTLMKDGDIVEVAGLKMQFYLK